MNPVQWKPGEAAIPQSLVARAVAGFRNMFAGDQNQNTSSTPPPFNPPFAPYVIGEVNWRIQVQPQDWFGPGQPLSPVAPADTAGRQFDYPTYSNIDVLQKPREGIDFPILRNLVQSYDLVGMLIDTRLDQLCKLGWSIGYRDDNKEADKAVDAISDFFRAPDREHSWQEWLRLLARDMLEIDAATIFPRMTRGGELYALETVDGSTINRIIDSYGRTPLAPDPAYQQRLKGLPAVNYTREQLIYKPRNIANNKLFGMSPVERLVILIQTAIHRELYQLQYYTDGTTPDLILSGPSTWTAKQLAEFEQYWSGILRGNTAERRGMRFVPGGVKVIDTKENALKDAFDEWIARKACYCFGMSPQPFVSMMNRATAETADQQSKEEGIGPHMAWVKSTIDFVLAHPKCFNRPDLEFQFEDSEETDPKAKAEVFSLKVKMGATTLDEWRQSDGDEPLPNGMGSKPMIYTATGAQLLEDVMDPPEPTPAPIAPVPGAPVPPKAEPKPPAAKVQGELDLAPAPAPVAKRSAKKKRVETTPTAAQVAGLKKIFGKALKDAAREVATQYAHAMGKAAGGVDPDTFIAGVKFAAFGVLAKPFAEQIADAAEGAFTDVLVEVGADADPVFGLANARAQAIAEARAGELIGSDADGGELADATRLLMRGTIVDAFENGWSSGELSDALEAAYGFSADRAEVIAETEMRMAIGSGAIEGARASGLVAGKQWLLSNDEGVCDDCEGNADDGVIGLDADFTSGDDTVPAHPNCRCVVVFTTEDEEGDE